MFYGGNRNMKFDIVIGNPPYQLSDGGAQASSRPIYQLFVQQAIALKPKYISMIMPSRWMAGGKGLDDFRESFISDKHILKLNDFTNSKVCFPNNDIKGGVCFFLWDREYKGKCQIIKSDNGKISKSARYLKEGNVDIFIRDDRLVEILKKVVA